MTTTNQSTTALIPLSVDVPNGSSFNLPYPVGETQATVNLATGHKLARDSGTVYSSGFTVSFGASYITVTNASLGTLRAGTKFMLQVALASEEDDIPRIVRDTSGAVLGLVDQFGNPLGSTPRKIAQSFSPIQRDGAATGSNSWFVMKRITITGGTIKPNSKLIIVNDWSFTSSALTKSLGMDFGGTNFSGPGFTTQLQVKTMMEIQAIGIASQRVQNTTNFATNSVYVSLTKDLTADQLLDIKCMWSAADASGESIILLGHSVYLLPGDE